MITQEQQNDMDRAISDWITSQSNACEDGEEQEHFRQRLLSASIHMFFYPHLNDDLPEKLMRMKEVVELVGNILGNATSKFLKTRMKP